MNKLRLAVVGTGHLGRIHARLAAQLADAELRFVVDPVAIAREQTAETCGAQPLADYRDLAGQVDAAILACPTALHHRVGLDLLGCGMHLLMEKPLAASLDEADQLVDAARRAGLVLQVGHVERFNPALEAAQPHLVGPKYIEGVRASGYTFRSTDVGVVLDLMIHDLDITLALADSELVDVQALGISIMGQHEDMAQARLTFANGCVANLSASRTSFEPCRQMQVYCPRSFATIDFANRTARLIAPHEELLDRQFKIEHLKPEQREHYREHLFRDLLPLSDLPVAESNPLLEEQRDFVAAIRHGGQPRVTGAAGRAALAAAERILECIARHNWEGPAALPQQVGPLALPLPHVLPGPQPAPFPQRKAG